MKILKNNCRYSGVKVSPANWMKTESVRKTWFVHYRFFDDNTGKSIRIQLRRELNSLETAYERRSYAYGMVQELIYQIEKLDYNPITGYVKEEQDPVVTNGLISPDTPFIEALELAREKKVCSDACKKDLKGVIKYTSAAIKYLAFDFMEIKDVRRRHIKAIFERLAFIKKDKWTANNQNFYRSHLSMLFSELLEWETIEVNPVAGIKKQKHTPAKKVTLTDEEIEQINTKLKVTNYPFWRLIQLFFHSGSRLTEFMKLKASDIDVKNQMASYHILKGKHRIEQRVIKTIALPLWNELLSEAKPGQHLFSVGLRPGDKAIRTDQIRRRWRQWCQGKGERLIREGKKLHVAASFYSLKHKNSQDVADLLNIDMAARLNAHKPAITEKHYLTDDTIKNELLKGLGNTLGSVPE